MAFCTNCKHELNENSAFCPNCGTPVNKDASAAQTQPNSQAQKGSTSASPSPANGQAPKGPGKLSPKVRLFLITGLATAVVAGLIIALVVLPALRKPAQSAGTVAAPQQSKPSLVDKESSSKTQDSTKDKDKDKEKEKEKSGPDLAAIAKAYAAMLDDAPSYFSDEWFGQHPDGEYQYTLAEMSGDDVPELLLGVHYSNIGSHKSGGMRVIPFIYDVNAGAPREVKKKDYELFSQPWSVLGIAKDGHALISSYRENGTNNKYERITAEGTVLTNVDVPEDQAESTQLEMVPVTDRSLLSKLDSNANADSQSKQAEQPKQTEQDAEKARRDKLRKDAEAAGKQVFEGTLRILSGEEVSALDGTPINANGASVAEQWRNSTYAYLMFDQTTTVNNVAYDTGTTSRDVDHICIGMNESRRQSMGNWPSYDGQRVCVACTGFSQSDGVSLVMCPATYEGNQAELLYAEGEGGGQAATEAPKEEAAKDEQMVVAYENEDFVVKMPASWQGTYIVRPYEDGAFMCGTQSELDNPSNWGSITMIVPWADGSGNCELVGTSSSGKQVYIRRGPNGFFDNGATIAVK